MRGDLVAHRTARARLEREVNTLRPRVDEASARRGSLLALQRQVADFVGPSVVADPALPESPVAPRKLLNMALAGFWAASVGVSVALLVESWSADQVKRRACGDAGKPKAVVSVFQSSFPDAQVTVAVPHARADSRRILARGCSLPWTGKPSILLSRGEVGHAMYCAMLVFWE